MPDNSPHVSPSCQADFMQEVSRVNMQRGKLFTLIIIGIELLLLMLTFLFPGDTNFKYSAYTCMYFLMIVVTAAARAVFACLEKKIGSAASYAKLANLSTTIYVGFVMVWGAVITLMDQALYGNVVAFIVNMLCVSFMFYIKTKHILVAQLIAGCVLFVGLPYFQPSSNILIGHYINISIFMVFAWLIARTNYNNYVKNFMNQRLIEEKSLLLAQINENLIKEIYSRKKAQQELEATNKRLTTISNMDALTGIPNRRRLNELINQQWDRAVAERVSISIMMIDIDFFKLYNDNNGHLAGDRCLQAIAEVLNRCRRGARDFVARYGGEEFLFVAAGMSRRETLLLGEKIRAEVEGLAIQHNISPISPYITASVGVSWLIPGSSDNLAESIDQADRALYQAKQNGRNQVIFAA